MQIGRTHDMYREGKQKAKQTFRQRWFPSNNYAWTSAEKLAKKDLESCGRKREKPSNWHIERIYDELTKRRRVLIRTLTSILAAGACFGSCKGYKSFDEVENPNYLSGEIISQSGTAPALVSSTGAMFGNDSIKIGEPSYVMVVRTKQGDYVLNVVENGKSLLALAEAAKTRKHITFRTNRYVPILPGIWHNREMFCENRIGSIESGYIAFEDEKKINGGRK
jgi:hypothetical protein